MAKAALLMLAVAIGTGAANLPEDAPDILLKRAKELVGQRNHTDEAIALVKKGAALLEQSSPNSPHTQKC